MRDSIKKSILQHFIKPPTHLCAPRRNCQPLFTSDRSVSQDEVHHGARVCVTTDTPCRYNKVDPRYFTVARCFAGRWRETPLQPPGHSPGKRCYTHQAAQNEARSMRIIISIQSYSPLYKSMQLSLMWIDSILHTNKVQRQEQTRRHETCCIPCTRISFQ